MNVHPIGSDFSWYGTWRGRRIPLPEPHVLFSLGRDAVAAALGARDSACSCLWVPSFFCPDVVAAWKNRGIRIERYPDDPRLAEPKLDLLVPGHQDAVLAVNFFGVRRQAPWLAWKERHPGVTLIEDHTHDPASPWAVQSLADFAFASLRKTLPVPDGAVLWSPRAHDLPATSYTADWTGSGMKLAGMLWKREHLERTACPDALIDGAVDENLKPIYRRFETEGELELERHHGQPVSPWSKALIGTGIPAMLRAKRESNTRAFISNAVRHGLPGARLLFLDWPTGFCPFNPVLVFNSATARDACRSHLIAAEIFPPIHWELPIDASIDNDALRLSRQILTIPLDFRCGETEIERVLKCLRLFECDADSDTIAQDKKHSVDLPLLPTTCFPSTYSRR